MSATIAKTKTKQNDNSYNGMGSALPVLKKHVSLFTTFHVDLTSVIHDICKVAHILSATILVQLLRTATIKLLNNVGMYEQELCMAKADELP